MKAPPQLPRIAKAPNFKEEGLTKHFDKLVSDIGRELQARPVRTEPVDGVLLMSPSGKIFKVTVDDLGVLSTVEMAS